MIAIAFGRITIVLLTILSLKIATQILSPENFGKWLLLNSTVAFFVLYFVSPVGQYINRHTHEWYQSKTLLRHLTKYHQYLLLIAITAGITLTFDHLSIQIFTKTFDLVAIFLIILGIYFLTLNQTYIPIFNMLHYRWRYIIFSILTSALGLFLSFVLCNTQSPSADYWMAGLLCSNAIVTFLAARNLRHALSEQNTNQSLQLNYKSIFSFSVPLFFVTGLAWLQSQGFRFIIERQLGLEQLAYFGAGYSVSAGVIAAVEGILSTYFLPGFYQSLQSSGNNFDSWTNIFRRSFIPIFSTSIILAFFSQYFIEIFLDPKYTHVGSYVAWGAACESLRVFNNIFQLLGHANKKTKSLVIPSIFGPAITIGFIFTFIHDWQLNVIGPSIAIGYAVTILMLSYSYRRSLAHFFNLIFAQNIFLLFVWCLLIFLIMQMALTPAIELTVATALYLLVNLWTFKNFLLRTRHQR